MNAAGYTLTALIVLACTGYLLLAPVWGRRKPPTPKWGHPPRDDLHVPTAAAPQFSPRRTDLRPMSAERMRSMRHETRKPRAPVRAVPRTDPEPVETPSDISTLLTIGMLNATGSPDCAPSDSSSSYDSGSSSCDSGGGDSGGGGGGSD